MPEVPSLGSSSTLKMVICYHPFWPTTTGFSWVYFDIIIKITFSSKATNVLTQLGKVAAYALKLTGIFCCQVTSRLRGSLEYSYSE